MNSVSYRTRWCTQCNTYRAVRGTKPDIIYGHLLVATWVITKVYPSRYIWEHVKGCQGCAKVMHEACEVLGNLLHKLGVKIT